MRQKVKIARKSKCETNVIDTTTPKIIIHQFQFFQKTKRLEVNQEKLFIFVIPKPSAQIFFKHLHCVFSLYKKMRKNCKQLIRIYTSNYPICIRSTQLICCRSMFTCVRCSKAENTTKKNRSN